MKPRIKPLLKTGDSTPYLVDGKRVVITGCMCAVTGKPPLALLADLIKENKLDGGQAPRH